MLRILKLSLVIFTCFVLYEPLTAQTFNQFYKAANSAYNSSEYEESILYFTEALTFKQNENEIYHKIAMSYYFLNDYTQAEVYFNKAQATDNNPLLYFYRASNYTYLGAYQNAIDTYKQFIEIYTIDGFYRKKAQQEIASSYWALDQEIDSTIQLDHYPKPLNTPYSDFAATYIDTQILQRTALLPSGTEKNTYHSTIQFFTKKGRKTSPLSTLSFPKIAQENVSYANGQYLKEKNEFYYSKCYTSHEDFEKICDLYVRKFDGKDWGEEKPLNINTEDFTETQAHVFINTEGQTEIYFVSDRLGGKGKQDIWKAIEIEFGTFTNPENLPTPINTIDNEASPYYDINTQTLYFSSAWHYGFGGYDIFESSYKNDQFSKPSNLGSPLNSSVDDLYYTPSAYHQSALFSSNREGAISLKNASCCFDIYEHEYTDNSLDTTLLTDQTTYPIEERTTVKTQTNWVEDLEKKLPVQVYFHNDEPNPRSLDTVTTLTYHDAFISYKNVKPLYEINMKDSLAVSEWFDYVIKQYFALDTFLHSLEKVLKEDINITLIIEGYCSPLAMNDYNLNLAKRRIVSVQNYLLVWNNEALRPYFNGGNLRFEELSFGENKADKTISDSREEIDKSVYSKAASLERRASIISIVKH